MHIRSLNSLTSFLQYELPSVIYGYSIHNHVHNLWCCQSMLWICMNCSCGVCERYLTPRLSIFFGNNSGFLWFQNFGCKQNKKIKQLLRNSWNCKYIIKMEEIGDVIVKWSGKEYTVTGLHNTSTVLQLKNLIYTETGVLPERQKLLGLKFSGRLSSWKLWVTV